jgi:hypothetical protein
MIDNKYKRWYDNIINNAKVRTLDGYFEKHHIIPRSLGGADTKENLVNLTAKEHFICHWLLIKFTENDEKMKMSYAFWMMIHASNIHQQNRYKLNSRTYQILKESLKDVFVKQHLGKKFSEEHRRKISETRKKRIATGEIVVNADKTKYKLIAEKRRGTKSSEETKKKIGAKHKGKKISDEQKERLSSFNKGKTLSPETREKIRQTLLAKNAEKKLT